MKFCILLLLSFLSFSLSKNDMENFPQLLQLVSNLVRLYHHIHYLPNQKETQIELLLKNEAQLLKDNDASLSSFTLRVSGSKNSHANIEWMRGSFTTLLLLCPTRCTSKENETPICGAEWKCFSMGEIQIS